MCDFLSRYGSNVQKSQATYAQIAAEFNKRRASELTPDRLLVSLVQERSTGAQEPTPAEFEDVEVAAAFQSVSEGTTSMALKLSDRGSNSTLGQSSASGQLNLMPDPNNLRAASALPGKFYA